MYFIFQLLKETKSITHEKKKATTPKNYIEKEYSEILRNINFLFLKKPFGANGVSFDNVLV